MRHNTFSSYATTDSSLELEEELSELSELSELLSRDARHCRILAALFFCFAFRIQSLFVKDRFVGRLVPRENAIQPGTAITLQSPLEDC